MPAHRVLTPIASVGAEIPAVRRRVAPPAQGGARVTSQLDPVAAQVGPGGGASIGPEIVAVRHDRPPLADHRAAVVPDVATILPYVADVPADVSALQVRHCRCVRGLRHGTRRRDSEQQGGGGGKAHGRHHGFLRGETGGAERAGQPDEETPDGRGR